jgi:hypothetical protein
VALGLDATYKLINRVEGARAHDDILHALHGTFFA